MYSVRHRSTSIPPVIISAGHTPRDLTFFLIIRLPIPRPLDSYLPQLCLYVYEKGWQYRLLYYSKNSRFAKNATLFYSSLNERYYVECRVIHKYHILFCSSQAETKSSGPPTKYLFTSSERCVAIAFDKPRARSNFLIYPIPLRPVQDRLKQFPTPGHEGLDLSRGLLGWWGNGNRWNGTTYYVVTYSVQFTSVVLVYIKLIYFAQSKNKRALRFKRNLKS